MNGNAPDLPLIRVSPYSPSYHSRNSYPRSGSKMYNDHNILLDESEPHFAPKFGNKPEGKYTIFF